jgi:hypothetical protein
VIVTVHLGRSGPDLTWVTIYVLVLFVTNQSDTAAEEALLMELAQLGMGMARTLHEVTLATRDVEPLVALTTAYCKVSRGVRQSLALRARFAARTVVTERAVGAEAAPAPPRPEVERADWSDYERPDWNERFATYAEPVERLDDDDSCRTRIRRDLTVVSRTPALAAIAALRPHAAAIAGRAALLGGASLRLVNTS